MPNAKLGNYLHLHLIVLIWGFTAVLGALISVEAVPLVWYRMGIAAVLLGGFLWWRGSNFKYKKKTLLKFAAVGLIIALHWLTFFGAIKASNVSVTLAVMAMGAFFTALLEPLIYKRKLIAYELIFGLLAVLGVVIIFNLDSQYTTGILLALCSSFLAALFAILNGKLVATHPAGIISFYELGFGTLWISLYLVFSNQFTAEFFALSSSDWGYLFLLASVCTAYAFLASVHVMKWLSPFTVMLTINLEPVYGILLGLWILGDSEKMSPKFYWGASLILATVILNGILKIRQARKRRNGATQ